MINHFAVLLFFFYFTDVTGGDTFHRWKRNCQFGLGNFNCEGRANGLYANHLRSCRQYFNCTGNVTEPQILNCPPTKPFFNDFTKSCVTEIAEDSVCGVKFDSGLDATLECRGRVSAGGFHLVADLQSRCQRFAICYAMDAKRTVGFWQECQSGYRFDSATNSCQLNTTVKCPCTLVCPVGLVCN